MGHLQQRKIIRSQNKSGVAEIEKKSKRPKSRWNTLPSITHGMKPQTKIWTSQVKSTTTTTTSKCCTLPCRGLLKKTCQRSFSSYRPLCLFSYNSMNGPRQLTIQGSNTTMMQWLNGGVGLVVVVLSKVRIGHSFTTKTPSQATRRACV